jgi:transposase
VRFNAEDLAGLIDRRYGRRPERLTQGEQAALVAYVLRGPNPERGEPSSWTLPDLCRVTEERFDKRMCPQSMSPVVRRLGLSRQKARPVHPGRDAQAAEALTKDPMGQRMAEPWLGLGSDHLHPEPGHERHRHDCVAC